METETLLDVRVYKEQFWAEQKARESVRAEQRKVDIRKQEAALAKLKNPCNGRRILEVAQVCGCGIQHGGREGTYIVAPDGSRQPVSVHPKDTSPGMRNAARKFIERVVASQS